MMRLVARKILARANDHPAAILATAFLLGQGLLAAIWQMLALGGWFSLPVIIGVLVASFLHGLRYTLPVVVGFGRHFRTSIRDLRHESPPWLVIYALIILLILMTGIATINPPQPRGDSLAFYMALPKVVSASHRLLPLPGYEAFTQIGLQGEFHFAALISLSGGLAAKMFLWPMGLAAASMLVFIGEKVGLGRRGKWIVLAALFTSTAFTNSIWNGKVDLFSAALGLAALAWSLEIGERPTPEVVRLVGLSAGFAIAAKITYLIPLVPGLLFIFVYRLRASHDQGSLLGKKFIPAALNAMFWLGLWMALPLVPNALKNGVLFGQPLAPLFNSGETARWMQAWFTPSTTSKIILMYPFSLVFGRYWGQEGQLTPIFLAFTPLLVLLPRSGSLKNSKLAQVALAGMLGIIFWVIYSPSAFAPRNLMASLLVLLVLGARGAEFVSERLNPRSLALSTVIIVTLLVTLLIGISGLMNLTKTGLLIAVGREAGCDREQYSADATCRIAEIINEDAAPHERLFLASYYRYWFRPDIIQCLNGTEETSELEMISSAEDGWSHLFQNGYRYVVIDELTHDWTANLLNLDQVPDWLEVTEIFEDDPFVAYRLDSLDPVRQPEVICSQIDPPGWGVTSLEGN
jgi:hypothetical protein